MQYFTTVARTETIEVPFEQMPLEAQQKIIAYGCQRVFNDMVGGNDRFANNEQKVAHVKEQIARFMRGDIGRAQSTGVSGETSIARQLVRAGVKKQYGQKSPEWKEFIGLSDRDQEKFLDVLIEKHKDRVQVAVAAEIARRAQKVQVEFTPDF
jgi:hypothetical protein